MPLSMNLSAVLQNPLIACEPYPALSVSQRHHPPMSP